MKKLLAFKNCSEGKADAIASARQHVKLDMIRQGTYGDSDGYGCSISCHYGGNNHAKAPAKHGFAILFVYLCDSIFEAQPDLISAQEFHIWVMENVAEGADTMAIWWEFFALTVEGIGLEWAEFAAECRVEKPDLEKLSTLALARDLDRALALALARALARDLDRALALALARALARDRDRDRALGRNTENFKKAVLKFAEPEKSVSL